MRILLILFVILKIINLNAVPVNCQSLWHNGFPQEPGLNQMHCEEVSSIEGGKFKVFRYDDGFTNDAKEVSLIENLKTALLDSITTYKQFGKLNKIYVIYLNGVSDDNPFANATTFHQGFYGYEACPIIVYKKALTIKPEFQKQMMAHEVFHCFEAFNFEKQYHKPGSNFAENQEIVNWWAEGGAEFFSNVVYPTYNYEYENTISYDQNLSLHKQSNKYSTSAFFQSFANNSYTGPQEIINFFKMYLPSSGDGDDQQNGLSKYYLMYYIFHKFAGDYSTKTILDSSSVGNIPVSFIENYQSETVEKNNKTYTYDLKSFTLKTKLLAFEPDGLYKIRLMTSHELNDTQASYRKKESINPDWIQFYNTVPLEVDTNCADNKTKYEFLFTNTMPTPDMKNVSIEIEYKETPCLCKDLVPFDPCLYGKWQLNRDSFDIVMKNIQNANQNVEYIGSFGNMFMEIKQDKSYYVLNDEFGFNYIASPNDKPIPTKHIFGGELLAKVGAIDKETICLKNGDSSMYTDTEIIVNGDQFSTSTPMPFSGGQVKFFCNGSSVRMISNLPIGPGGSTIEQELIYDKIQ